LSPTWTKKRKVYVIFQFKKKWRDPQPSYFHFIFLYKYTLLFSLVLKQKRVVATFSTFSPRRRRVQSLHGSFLSVTWVIWSLSRLAAVEVSFDVGYRRWGYWSPPQLRRRQFRQCLELWPLWIRSMSMCWENLYGWCYCLPLQTRKSFVSFQSS